MGKKKKNSKASQEVVKSTINEGSITKVQVELPGCEKERYDDSNLLVLPNKKKTAKKILPRKEFRVKKLTKRERKKLEKVVEAKKKKANRKQVLEDLSKVQATDEELALLTSIARMQTKGLKRHFIEAKFPQVKAAASGKFNILKGQNKRAKVEHLEKDDEISSETDEDSASSVASESENLFSPANEIQMIEDSADGKVEGDSENKIFMKTKITESNEKSSDQKLEMEKEISEHRKLEAKCISESKPTVFVPVHRLHEIQVARLKLPILAEEQTIMEAINDNSVVILCGETGSGKTTQVPQFLYESGYAREKIIGITEPRRVAAISMSKRVAEEMNLGPNEVSFQIRFKGNVTPDTKIKFMTDGVLLKEIQNDFLLTKYSVIIIDEAHERSVYSDILIGLLSRIVPLRFKRKNPLKLIIMSATLRVEDFTENRPLFKRPPTTIQVDSRQFSVAVHFNKHTVSDYVSEAFRKVCKIHRTLPSGGILVFVTGQQEVNVLCYKLRKAFPMNDFPQKSDASCNSVGEQKENDDSDDDFFKKNLKKLKGRKKKKIPFSSMPKINLDDYAVLPLEDNEDEANNADFSDLELESDEEISKESEIVAPESRTEPLYVLPLYSLLPLDRQAKVFGSPPEGTRLCVIATNVAETSLTIPHVKYVVDSGKVKTRLYDKVTGVSTFAVTWTSKASADQRAGRAGRTAPGHCYRLYSSAVFNDQFQKFSIPEICRKPVDDLVLQMKALNIERVVNFPFPSSPDPQALKAAEGRLRLLGALEEIPKTLRFNQLKTTEWASKITSLGSAMASFPVAPSFAKMLVISHQHDLLPYVICIVSALTVQELLLDNYSSELQQNDSEEQPRQRTNMWKQTRRNWAGEGNSLLLGDVMVLLKAVGATEYAKSAQDFCLSQGLRFKAIIEIRKLRSQLTSSANLILPTLNLSIDPKMEPPTQLQANLLRQIILAGLPHHVARKISPLDIKDGEDKLKYKGAYQCSEVDDLVYIHPNSVLYKSNCQYIVYQEIFETSKLYMRGITAIEEEWLPIFVSGMCSFAKPLDDPKPHYDKTKGLVLCHMSSTFGPHNWALPIVEMEYPPGLDRIRWFAVALLEGEVYPKLLKFRSLLLSLPVTMIKSWAKLQPRTESLLANLVEKDIDCKAALDKAWKENDEYLLEAYLEWVPESLYATVRSIWPPL